jgi:hypothetical protein
VFGWKCADVRSLAPGPSLKSSFVQASQCSRIARRCISAVANNPMHSSNPSEKALLQNRNQVSIPPMPRDGRVPKQHPAKRCISLLTALAFPLQHRGIRKNRLSAGRAAASLVARAGAEPSIRIRATSLAWDLQISGAPHIDGRDPE